MQKTKYKGKKVHYNAESISPAKAERIHRERRRAGMGKHSPHLREKR
jgi:hypothetical protein